ncbi:MAG: YeeE/YedE family protein [Beijerinckiaceae bacterium]
MSFIQTPIRTAGFARPDLNAATLLAAAALLAALGYASAFTPGNDWRMPALTVVGGLIGFVLYRASFGFSAAFRSLVEERNPYAFRAHAVMIGLASAAFLPMIAAGEFLGFKTYGPATTIGPAFMLGALMFGIGMQIGGGCASGTLYGLGGGNLKLAGTLLGFVLGSVIGASHMEYWWSLPAVEPLVIQNAFGLWPALALQAAVLGIVFWLATRYGRAPAADPAEMRLPLSQRLLAGRWPLMWGAVALALLNIATLVLSSRPWGETQAFVLWGSKVGDALGLTDSAFWLYWQRPGYTEALDAPILTDVTSVMDIAIPLGAAVAAALSGAFRLGFGGGLRPWAGAILGGVLMGYGARLSNGCNISAYFSSLAAGNASGWLWLAVALAGCWIGLKLRPLFALGRSASAEGASC